MSCKEAECQVSELPWGGPHTTALFTEKQHLHGSNLTSVPALLLLFILLLRGIYLQYDSQLSLFTVSQSFPSRSFSFVNLHVLSV